jgi:hypothetical protein
MPEDLIQNLQLLTLLKPIRIFPASDKAVLSVTMSTYWHPSTTTTETSPKQDQKIYETIASHCQGHSLLQTSILSTVLPIGIHVNMNPTCLE